VPEALEPLGQQWEPEAESLELGLVGPVRVLVMEAAEVQDLDQVAKGPDRDRDQGHHRGQR
jgi:hypothetical protein